MKHRLILALVLLLTPTFLFAQAQGRVKGTVVDSNRKPIPNAKVTVTCPEISSYKKEIPADGKGVFTMLIVDATKQYLFHVEAPGFQTMEQLNKPLIGGQTLELTFTLKSVQELQVEAEKQVKEKPGIKEFYAASDLLEAARDKELYDNFVKHIEGSPYEYVWKKAGWLKEPPEFSKGSAALKAEARAKFAEAVTAKPDLSDAWRLMGALDLEAGKAEDALKNAEQCLKYSADNPRCLGLAADAAKAKGDTANFDKYMALYKKANPTDPSTYYNEAVAFLNKQDDAKAKPLLEQALQADPNYADALFQLGMVQLRAGDSAQAKDLLQRFLKAAPNHKEAPTATDMLKYL